MTFLCTISHIEFSPVFFVHNEAQRKIGRSAKVSRHFFRIASQIHLSWFCYIVIYLFTYSSKIAAVYIPAPNASIISFVLDQRTPQIGRNHAKPGPYYYYKSFFGRNRMYCMKPKYCAFEIWLIKSSLRSIQFSFQNFYFEVRDSKL